MIKSGTMNKIQQKPPIPNQNKWHLNCREATELMVRNEFESLSLINWLAMKYHVMICKLCRLFQNQSAEMNHILRNSAKEQPATLRKEKKEEMTEQLNRLIQKRV